MCALYSVCGDSDILSEDERYKELSIGVGREGGGVGYDCVAEGAVERGGVEQEELEYGAGHAPPVFVAIAEVVVRVVSVVVLDGDGVDAVVDGEQEEQRFFGKEVVVATWRSRSRSCRTRWCQSARTGSGSGFRSRC